MTNRQWLEEKIKNMSDDDLCHLLKGSNINDYIYVEYDYKYGNCMCNWLTAEYKEKPELTNNERILLNLIDKKFKWISKDDDGTLTLWADKPEKNEEIGMWVVYEGTYSVIQYLNSSLFQFIKWEDDEPYEISKLLKEE